MSRHPLHLKIISLLNLIPSKSDLKERAWVSNYLGTDKPTRCIKIGELKKIAIKYPGDTDLITSLYRYGTSFDELAIAAYLVSRVKNKIDPRLIDKWLNYTVGWAEVDSLCQSNFDAAVVLTNWPQWHQFLVKLSDDKNIQKRRASMVLLCKSLRQSDDSRLSDLAFELVDKLKFEKEILITKAVSWILRSLVKHHPDELAVYLENNQISLPRIAYREASKKLTTGRKN